LLGDTAAQAPNIPQHLESIMDNRKFMFIYPQSLAQPPHQPTQQEVMAIMERWQSWKAKFKDHILDLGDALKPGGKTLAAGVVTDGPYPELKEVVGGYSLVSASSYEHAIEIARECPISFIPGARIEIRELAGYG
jgi:hypothetical protein